jgi:hypothetical protein
MVSAPLASIRDLKIERLFPSSFSSLSFFLLQPENSVAKYSLAQ